MWDKPKGIPGTTFITLHSFTGTDGSKSFAGLLRGKNGNLYGTTYFGGAKNDGVVFQITAAGKLTTLHSFCSASGCADGGYSYAVPVLGADGNFYGTTYLGGSKGDGTVFKMSPSGALTTLHSFEGADGSQPLAGLAAGSDGNFYGTTNLGGSHNAGSVFKVTPSGQFTTVHSFCSKTACADGQNSYAGLILASDGNLYRTTLAGGSHGDGTVFKSDEGRRLQDAVQLLFEERLCRRGVPADGTGPGQQREFVRNHDCGWVVRLRNYLRAYLGWHADDAL